VILNITVGIRADTTAFQPYFSLDDSGEAIIEVNLMITYGFDFRTQKNDTSFESFQDMVVVKRLPVVDKCLLDGHWSISKQLFLAQSTGKVSPGGLRGKIDQAILANSLGAEQFQV